MSARFEELDWQPTPMGDISLRRRRDPGSDVDVYEVLLGEEFLMSSRFTAGEVALATLGLEALDLDHLDVLVGGLGLGYTALAVLDDTRVRSLTVVDALADVIGWHARGLLPHATALTTDPRSALVHRDFFAMIADGSPCSPHEPWHAILVDIDHTPRHVLHPSHRSFYSVEGLLRLSARLHPGGVFALWSDAPPDDDFLAVLSEAFESAHASVVTFANPLIDGESSNTVYVARRPLSGA